MKNDDGSYDELSALLFENKISPVVRISISDSIKKYVETCTSQKCIKNQSVEKLYFLIFNDFLFSLKLECIDEVTPEHIDQFENFLLKKMKAASVNRRFNTIKHFFNKSLLWGHILKNPCFGKKKKREEVNPRRPWTLEVFNKFIKSCSGTQKSIFQFLWMTGCRPMELKNLKWTDINYDQKTITLRCGKNAHVTRSFPITDELDHFLHNIKFDTNFVFTENKKQINSDTLYHYCKKRLNSLGLSEFTVYGIRHGFGTKLALAGVSAFYIAELMGHSKLETTKKYIHSDKKQLIKALCLAK